MGRHPPEPHHAPKRSGHVFQTAGDLLWINSLFVAEGGIEPVREHEFVFIQG